MYLCFTYNTTIHVDFQVISFVNSKLKYLKNEARKRKTAKDVTLSF